MSNTILINYTGRKGAGCLDAYESARGFIDNGQSVIAIVSEYSENLDLWQKLPLKKLVTTNTYSSKCSFFFSTLRFLFIGRHLLKRKFIDEKIDYIYCPMITFWTGFINSLFKNIPKYIVNHDPIPHFGEVGKIAVWFNDRIYDKCDVIVVHSRKFIEFVSKKYGKQTIYIPLGRHNIYQRIFKRKIVVNYDTTKSNFLFFGRISPYKGLEYLYDAYSRLGKEFNNIHLTIAGNGDFSAYQAMYESLNSVTILNKWIADDEIESLFQCKNLICVLPYIEATQSGVVLVAMDYGIPLIATNTGGLAEQIEDERTGLLVEPKDSDGLYSAMKKMLENRSLYLKISENQKSYIRTLDWQNSMRIVDNLYNSNKKESRN